MPRIFTDNIAEGRIALSPEDTRHILKVLRLKKGDEVVACDKQGTDYICQIEDTGDVAILKIISSQQNQAEPKADITLYQAVPKGDKLDFIVQKAVELGAGKIVPVYTRFCVAKPKDDGGKKLARLNKIAQEAAKQCGRGILPQVAPPLSFSQAVAEMAAQRAIVFYEKGGGRVADIVLPSDPKISLLVGSEGGFSAEEIEICKNSGILPATLGKLILRCETAPIAGITLVLNALGEI